ncbi:hypothetical protein PTTG_10342 [Puccinia triticina 1-1 BBBD Race 1]|uniref:Uncharacterized protein n=1 Tax=Puccinia triticina (isolate 1-1 / race 1 (BBBD)) TaxID=630390 RepID=A0A180H177_PUCT1|nr:hypothetical protein PTTG_10342 [Puccinia triticina 1-1 BBBD Race 1]WAR58355.1 hypothetical protein PtB15_5B589 [Puccinia triticina]
MLSTVYVAFLFAATALATPVRHTPRTYFNSHSQEAGQAGENHYLQATSNPLGSTLNRGDSSNSAYSRQTGTTYGSGYNDGLLAYPGGILPQAGPGATFDSVGTGYNPTVGNNGPFYKK